MPTFDFQCRECEHVFEFSRPFGSSDVPKCTECDGETEKLIAPPAIHFKGQGFYKTDSSKKEVKAIKETEETKETEDSKDTKGAKDEKKETSKKERKADSPKKSKD